MTSTPALWIFHLVHTRWGQKKGFRKPDLSLFTILSQNISVETDIEAVKGIAAKNRKSSNFPHCTAPAAPALHCTAPAAPALLKRTSCEWALNLFYRTEPWMSGHLGVLPLSRIAKHVGGIEEGKERASEET